jgi:glycosyltransferase involved in cell wall biosynthesis
MKISVMIIAHNEEKYIRKCLRSVTSQTRKPDEIVLISHNCTDKTESIANEFPSVRTVPYSGEVGIISARIKGFEEVAGDIILCTDGDSFVLKNWVEKMVEPFEKNQGVVGVGSPVIYYGVLPKLLLNIISFLGSYIFDILVPMNWRKRMVSYFWGPSMAVRRDAYVKIGGLSKFSEFKKSNNLIMSPDDTYLSILLSNIGKVYITYRTMVFARSKENNYLKSLKITRNHLIDGNILFKNLPRSGDNPL